LNYGIALSCGVEFQTNTFARQKLRMLHGLEFNSTLAPMIGGRMTPLAENVHKKFRGASEVAKAARIGALVIDLAAASLACLGIFGVYKSPWMPLALLFGAVLAVGCRSFASSVRSFAQRCRRASLRAFCFDDDVDIVTESNTTVDAPFASSWFATRVPAVNMEEYYEPVCPPGENRLRELYAHSAFYTWQMLRTHSKVVGVLAICVFVLSFCVIYGLATDPPEPSTRNAVLEALCTIILVLLCVQAVERASEAASSAREARQIEESPLRKPMGKELLEIADAYDIERAAGPDVPTTLYRIYRNGLQQQWHNRRKALVEC